MVVPFVRSRYKVRELFSKCKVRESSLKSLFSGVVACRPTIPIVLHSAYFTSRPILFPSALVLAQKRSYASMVY